MLTVFRLAHFKSYEHAELPLGPITLLIGANASGKSNAIEALRLLSWLAQGLLLSTHNPALADALPDEALWDVVCCYRDPHTGASRLQKLGELEDVSDLLVKGPLGHLMTSGAIERFVKQPVDHEAKRRQGLEWIERVRSIGGAAS